MLLRESAGELLVGVRGARLTKIFEIIRLLAAWDSILICADLSCRQRLLPKGTLHELLHVESNPSPLQVKLKARLAVFQIASQPLTPTEHLRPVEDRLFSLELMSLRDDSFYQHCRSFQVYQILRVLCYFH